jgi:hypothetical protein
MDDIENLKDEKFTSIVKMLEELPDTYENCHDKDKVWYDKINHITDLEYEIIRTVQTEKAIENLSIIDKKLADGAQIRHKFTLDQKDQIEILWKKEYEKINGVDKFLKNWNKDLVTVIWKKKFKECLWHLALVCQYHKKYYLKDSNGRIVFIPLEYPHQYLFDLDKRMYEREMMQGKKKVSY